MVRRVRNDPLAALTSREREVLSLMAEGHGNAVIAKLLFLAETSVNKHIGNIFAKLGLPATDGSNRRVRAVLTYLNSMDSEHGQRCRKLHPLTAGSRNAGAAGRGIASPYEERPDGEQEMRCPDGSPEENVPCGPGCWRPSSSWACAST